MSKYKNLAIFVATPEESKIVQEELFVEGAKWVSGNATFRKVLGTLPTVLFVENDLTISYTPYSEFDVYDHAKYKVTSFAEFMEIDMDVPAKDSNPSNPKAAIGSKSLPITMLSPLTCALGSLGKLNGMLKYGGANYIGTNVVFSIYLDAIRRHLDKVLMGEDCDVVDGVPHFGAILANIDIIVSAQAAGTLIDDRLRCDGQLEAVAALTPLVASLQELHKDKQPKHYYMDKKL